MDKVVDWPELTYEKWAPTKKTLHLCAQMLGKTRLALVPPQPEWLNSCLYLDGHGFATGPMPSGSRVVTMGIDVFSTEIWIRTSDGRDRRVSIGPNRCVADIWRDYQRALDELAIKAQIWPKPQELADTTPFGENTRDCTIVPEHAQRFHTVLSSMNAVFEEFRSQFFGRSGVQFWWGAFDLSVLLFSGRHVAAPEDRGYIMRYDLDAEHFNAGFWPGDDTAPQAGFYAYLHPRPDGCETAPVEPEQAGWVESVGEWMLPYDSVRDCDDPVKAIRDFLDSVYRVAVDRGGWDAVEHWYTKPAPPTRA
jgi:hypothetical protein